MVVRVMALLLLLPVFAGCLSGEAPPAEGPDDEPTTYPSATFEAGRVQVDIPVPVVLVGFPAGTAETLAGLLPELRPDAHTYNNARLLSAGFLGGVSTRPNPMDPTAVYSYHELPEARAALDTARSGLELVPGLLNATAVEDLLANELAAAGVPVSADRPGFVLLHLGDESDHAYRMVYPTGYVDGVRAFGERHPFTVLDASARVDPYVGTSNAFNSPVPAEGSEEVLAQAVERVTWYRTLQGPIYPQSIRECHAVTLLVVWRASTISQVLPSYSKAEDLLDADYLTGAWESLLGEGRVHVDPVLLSLPADDPVLEAVLRDSSNELLRVYMNESWEQYHVAHDGCEAYLSVFLIGDVADNGVSGIAMYDVDEDRRISMSWMNDLTLFQEQDGEAAPIFYVEDETRDRTDWVNFLFSHETGHLFGQRHPHDISSSGGPPGGHTFASVWSTMSYQQDGKIPLFGAIDQNNYWRNRAGFLAEAAAFDGADDQPVFDEALALMGQHQWQEAGDLLLPIVNG